MRQNQRGSTVHQSIQCLLDYSLVLGIDGGQRFIENQDGCIEQQRPRDRKSLALSARKPSATLTNQCLVAIRQRLNEIVCVCGPRRRLDLVLTRLRAPQTDVVLHRAVEQIGVLRNNRDLSAYIFGIELAHIAPANTYRANLRVVETQQ